MIAFVGIMWLAFGRHMEDDTDRLDILATVDPRAAIKNRPLMFRALIVLGLTLVGFLFHSVLGLEAATIALLGATILMLVGPLDPHEALRDIEWNTLFFFVGLFMLIEAVVHVGIVGGIADGLADAAGGDLTVATMGIRALGRELDDAFVADSVGRSRPKTSCPRSRSRWSAMTEVSMAAGGL